VPLVQLALPMAQHPQPEDIIIVELHRIICHTKLELWLLIIYQKPLLQKLIDRKLKLKHIEQWQQLTVQVRPEQEWLKEN
jgi:hypothetical protein